MCVMIAVVYAKLRIDYGDGEYKRGIICVLGEIVRGRGGRGKGCGGWFSHCVPAQGRCVIGG